GQGRCSIERDAAACARRGGVPGEWPSCCTACTSTPCFPSATPAVSAEECQAEKIEALGALRSCRASARAIQVEGGSADAGPCERAFEVALGAASTKVTGSDVPCRFWDGGDGTVLDLHTGLVWGQATPTAAAPWSEAMSDLVAGEVGASDDGVQLVGCRADRC